MTNKLIIAIVAVLIVIAVVVVILAYTYLDIGLNPRGGGELRVALSSFSAETLDPSLDNADGLRYHGHLYDFLVGVDSEGRLLADNGLLAGWQASPTADAFTLTLRNGAAWHDGTPVTAQDIPASVGYYFRENSTCGVCGAAKSAVAAVEVVDNENVRFQLNGPDVVFPALLASVEGDMPLLPAHSIADEAPQDSPIGSGPWQFAEKSQGESVRYESNEEYWNAERTSPFDSLSLTLVPEEAERLALLETDRIDIAPIRVASIDRAKSGGYVIDGPKHVVSTALRFFMSYDEDYLTSSLEFRRALALSANMPEIVAAAYPPEAASLATGSALFTPVSPGYIEDLSAYPFDRICGRKHKAYISGGLWSVGNAPHQRNAGRRLESNRRQCRGLPDGMARRAASFHGAPPALRRICAFARPAWRAARASRRRR